MSNANSSATCATCTTKPASKKNVTDVLAIPKRNVTYVFHTLPTGGDVNLPYAVVVNGAVKQGFEYRPKSIKGKGGHLTVTVDQGSTVELYLNSDAHPDYRKNPVYKVTLGERDIQVDITEKKGKLSDTDVPTLVPAPATGKDGKKLSEPTLDKYTAPLTGDIWMKVSHKYTESEAVALIPSDTTSEVKAAVKSIYAGLNTSKLMINVPATADDKAFSIAVTFIDSDNPKQNITKYSLLADGLTRVHPAGYAALFSAAKENKVASLQVTSCWRPMLGSIAHRAGLGLDVAVIDKIKLNRQELRTHVKKGTGNHNDNDNVTDAEVKAFREYEDALMEQKKNQANAALANQKLSLLQASLEKIPKNDAAKIEARKKEVEEAKKVAKISQEAADKSVQDSNRKEVAWDKERDAHEPASVHGYRASLLQCGCVAQLFDPWMMDADGHGTASPQPNMQHSDNEKLHTHHLHITVREPKIR